MNRPLDGVRIIDWTIFQQGPVATMMLGDLGAEVIKIEERVGGDPGRGVMSIAGVMIGTSEGHNFYFEANNRHKKSLTLDLKKPEAREIVYRLAEKSDVFVQNFRQGVAERLGLDYATLRQYNPRLIYASITALGSTGEYADLPLNDAIVESKAGTSMTCLA